MALINLTLQGKGGVGKSVIASLLAQYYQGRNAPLFCYDTDPVNRTFASYKSFKAEAVRLGDKPDELNPRYFDNLVEKLIGLGNEDVAVIDNGASTFLPLLGYMTEAAALDMLREAGHDIRLHAVIAGGPAMDDTLMGLAQVIESVPDISIVVWLNEFFGKIERRTQKGEAQGFEQSALYRQHQDRIHALVRLPEVRKETFGHDIEQMMRAKLTFDEAVMHESFPLMARQRLKMSWKTIHTAMEQAVL